MLKKYRKLADEVEFWRIISERVSNSFPGEFMKLTKERLGSAFINRHLRLLIKDIKRGVVDVDITLEQADFFSQLLDCEFVSENLRGRLSSLIYGGDERMR